MVSVPVLLLVDDVLAQRVDDGLAAVLVRRVPVPLQNLKKQIPVLLITKSKVLPMKEEPLGT